MKAYGDHFRVEDSKNLLLSTYDNGITSVFDMPSIDTRDVSMNYVGVLKISSNLIMVQCKHL